jgi:hypothetical protein
LDAVAFSGDSARLLSASCLRLTPRPIAEFKPIRAFSSAFVDLALNIAGAEHPSSATFDRLRDVDHPD